MRSVRGRGERGAITVWTAVVLIAFVLIVGIGVDFAGHTRATQEARSIAAEAARAGGQHVKIMEGHTQPNHEIARRAAENYVAASRFHGTVQVESDNTVTVTVTGEYNCTFLNAIGITTLPVRAEATSARHTS